MLFQLPWSNIVLSFLKLISRMAFCHTLYNYYWLFALFLMSSSSWLNHLLLGHPNGLFPYNFSFYKAQQVEWKWKLMSHKWRCDAANNSNWILIRVHSIGDSGTNLHNLPAEVKLIGHKCHSNTNTVLTQPTIMTTCSSETYFILSLHISITIFLCHAAAQIMPRPQLFWGFLITHN